MFDHKEFPGNVFDMLNPFELGKSDCDSQNDAPYDENNSENCSDAEENLDELSDGEGKLPMPRKYDVKYVRHMSGAELNFWLECLMAYYDSFDAAVAAGYSEKAILKAMRRLKIKITRKKKR